MTQQLFGTLFHANYLTRALTLYRSLERHVQGEFELVMLCMDAAALESCRRLCLPQARLLAVEELERHDPELVSVKPARTMGEYCWTCTPCLLGCLLDEVAPGERVVYLDADMMFFSDPQPVFDEWADADIAIHEHRFAPRHRHLEPVSGRFNVGWVGVHNSAEGRQCLARWRRQCLEACTFDLGRGLAGDQKYLDEWPGIYRRLAILQHPGVGVAPWNIERYELTSLDGVPQVDAAPVIFYHFHALRIASETFLGHVAFVPAEGYRFSPRQRRLLYRPYAAALRAAGRELARLSPKVELPRPGRSWRSLAHMLLRADILIARSSGRSYPLGAAIAALRWLNAARRRLVRRSAAASLRAIR